jgi:hypothetical protein
VVLSLSGLAIAWICAVFSHGHAVQVSGYLILVVDSTIQVTQLACTYRQSQYMQCLNLSCWAPTDLSFQWPTFVKFGFGCTILIRGHGILRYSICSRPFTRVVLRHWALFTTSSSPQAQLVDTYCGKSCGSYSETLSTSSIDQNELREDIVYKWLADIYETTGTGTTVRITCPISDCLNVFYCCSTTLRTS